MTNLEMILNIALNLAGSQAKKHNIHHIRKFIPGVFLVVSPAFRILCQSLEPAKKKKRNLYMVSHWKAHIS